MENKLNTLEGIVSFMGAVNKAVYGVNPYEGKTAEEVSTCYCGACGNPTVCQHETNEKHDESVGCSSCGNE